MLVTPPFGASSNIALWRANNKPPVELVVADLDIGILGGKQSGRKKEDILYGVQKGNGICTS